MIKGIDLKIVNYKEFAGHDGIPGYNLDIVYNGSKIAHAYDDAWGGEVSIRAIGLVEQDSKGKYVDSKKLTTNKVLLEELLEEASKLSTDEKRYAQLELEILIGKLINAKLVEKDAKKGIVYKGNYGWEIFGWKVSVPTMIKKHGKESIVKTLQNDYNSLKKEGKEILNTEYLQSIGIKL